MPYTMPAATISNCLKLPLVPEAVQAAFGSANGKGSLRSNSINTARLQAMVSANSSRL